MITTSTPTTGIDVLTSPVEIPGMGTIPINAFVLHGSQPVLVDTGSVVDRDEFMTVLGSVIDPADLSWIWLTHTDFDHIGSLHALLDANPRLRVITSFLAVGIMGLADPLPMDRVYLLNPGQSIDVGDRMLTAVKPPTFDNPVTTGFQDSRTGILFSADCFGAVLGEVPEEAAAISADALREGQVLWTSVDSPWLHHVDAGILDQQLDAIRALDATMILSSHLPPAAGDMTERMLGAIAAVPGSARFVGPDQVALEAMLAAMPAPT